MSVRPPGVKLEVPIISVLVLVRVHVRGPLFRLRFVYE